MAKPFIVATAQPRTALPSLDAVPLDFFYLRDALGAHEALAVLLVHCTQKTDGSDSTIPTAPGHLASLLTAANAQATRALNDLEREQATRRTH
jgi:hypothetical protein